MTKNLMVRWNTEAEERKGDSALKLALFLNPRLSSKRKFSYYKVFKKILHPTSQGRRIEYIREIAMPKVEKERNKNTLHWYSCIAEGVKP